METQTAKNKEIARRFWEAIWEERNLQQAAAYLSDDIQYNSPRVELQGKTKYLEMIEGYMNVLEDTHLMFEDQIAEKDKVFTKLTFSGVHAGDLGELPLTHKRIRFQVMNLLQIVDGKVKNEWEVNDELGLMQQLGMDLVQKEHAH